MGVNVPHYLVLVLFQALHTEEEAIGPLGVAFSH